MLLRKELNRRGLRTAARSGFTLMELMVVVAIIVLLAGAAVPLFMNYLEGAKRSRAEVDVQSISKAVELYRVKFGEFPASLAVLTQTQPDGSLPTFEPEKLLDPWKREYQYNPQGPHNSQFGRPDIWSGGANGNEQIGNWGQGR
jgi:general secretion pathway protein G